jgi:cobalt-zinc-cadmium efflux system protein
VREWKVKANMPHTRHRTDRVNLNRRLWISMGLNLCVTTVEVIGGLLSGSLGLLADAVHNLGDVAALGLAIIARTLGRRPATYRYTYGLKRVEILAAAVNALVLGVITIFIAHEAITRLVHPLALSPRLMLPVALVALLANLGSVLLLREHEGEDLNVRTAFLHLVQDALSSLVVVIAALLAQSRFGPYLDPIAALLIGVGVAWSTISIIWQAIGPLVEATPAGFKLEEMVQAVERKFSPARMHHVHVWEVGPGQTALSAHLSVPEMGVMQAEILASEIRAFLAQHWRIQHVTLEPEVNGCGSLTTLGEWNTPEHI